MLVISDIHGNASALRAIFANESPDEDVLFLGDAVSPGPQPNEVIDLLAARHGVFIAGNHDINMFDANAVDGWPEPWQAFYAHSYENLADDGFALLASFEAPRYVETPMGKIWATHGELAQRPRDLRPDSDDREFARLDNATAETVLYGHSHVQFERQVDGRRFINPGSVGQSRCGRRWACYGRIEEDGYRPCAVEYDATDWLADLRDIGTLDAHPKFRAWLERGFETGFSLGANDPWTKLGKAGYR